MPRGKKEKERRNRGADMNPKICLRREEIEIEEEQRDGMLK
jgi:hypothetical protein